MIMRIRTVHRRSYRRAGRLVPSTAGRLRSRSVLLKSGHAVDWHSTGSREELLIVISGHVIFEYRGAGRRIRRVALPAGACLFVSPRVEHRVVNCSPRMAHYLYTTG